MPLPAKTFERIKSSLKRFQPIIQSAKARDVNESDTVIIITDMLDQVFGYDKYSEITSEHAIRGTYCDLAVKLDGKLSFLIEAKAAGMELKDSHVKQAIDYAANQGVEWVILSNSDDWRVYKVKFGKPIEFETALQFNLLTLSTKKDDDIDILGMLTKEGWQKERLDAYYNQKEIVNRFTVGAALLTEPVLQIIRREIKRLSDDIKVSQDEIQNILSNEVIKRDVLEGDKAQQAQRLVNKAINKASKKSKEGDEETPANDASQEKKPVTAKTE